MAFPAPQAGVVFFQPNQHTPEGILHTVLLRRDCRDDCLRQARRLFQDLSYDYVTFQHPLIYPIPISRRETDATFQAKIAVQLELVYFRGNQKIHIVQVNSVTIRLMGTPRRPPTSSPIHTLPQDPSALLLAPTNSLISYNWETPGQVLFHFIIHPEEREVVRREARRMAQDLPPFSLVKLYHPLLPLPIPIYPETADLVLLRSLHDMLVWKERLWLIIPEMEFLPRDPNQTYYWAFQSYN